MELIEVIVLADFWLFQAFLHAVLFEKWRGADTGNISSRERFIIGFIIGIFGVSILTYTMMFISWITTKIYGEN